jgi:hypothetical protein
MAAKVVAAWRDANGYVVMVGEDGAYRVVRVDAIRETDWTPLPPVAEPVVVADAKSVEPWNCYECCNSITAPYRNLPSATRCGRCGSERP